MKASAEGATVSSIRKYSLALPVLAVWKLWLRPGIRLDLQEAYGSQRVGSVVVGGRVGMPFASRQPDAPFVVPKHGKALPGQVIIVHRLLEVTPRR